MSIVEVLDPPQQFVRVLPQQITHYANARFANFESFKSYGEGWIVSPVVF